MGEPYRTGSRDAGDILAIGFGTTVALWAIGYVARLPVVLAPAPLVLTLLVLALGAGGYIAGRFGARGVRDGAMSGALTGLLNVLVLGSFLSTRDHPNGLVPATALWLPGSIVFSSLLGAAGAFLGMRGRSEARQEPDWTSVLARVAVAATFLLLVAGGLVTGNQAGLAVVDWPSSYGYNMFLYPFSRMTGGIYYEHAHRLLGALVGLTTVTLAIQLARVETRVWVRRLSQAAVVAVIVQGILGGLRVTEKNILLAVAHGVTAQVFFSLLVAIAVVSSRTFRSERAPRVHGRAGADRAVATVAVVALVVQIVFGAIQRHLALGLMLHVVAAFLVAPLAISAGLRAWGRYGDDSVLRRAGLSLVHATGAQLVLGVCAWIARGAFASGSLSLAWKVVVTTLHQGTGALLLAAAVTLRLWLSRLTAQASDSRDPRRSPSSASEPRSSSALP